MSCKEPAACYYCSMPEQTISIKPAADVPRHDFVKALNEAYRDYYVPIQLGLDSFADLVLRESVDLSLSAAAVNGSQVVGMGLLGVRGSHAWIGGMGVIPDYRRQGIARRLMRFLIEGVHQRGLENVRLEVITTNQKAYDLYQSMGFTVSRRLLILSRRSAHRKARSLPVPAGYTVEPRPAAELLERLPGLDGTDRPWQRDGESLRIALALINGLAALRTDSGDLSGILLYNKRGRQISLGDIAAPDAEAGRALLVHLIRANPAADLSIINISEKDPVVPVMHDLGFTQSLDQYEMILPLDQEALG